SSTWSFTINTQGPAAPILSSPADGSTITDTTPSFAWSAVNTASYYQLQVDSSDSFSSLVIDQSDLTGTSFTAASALADNMYYWRVRGKDSQGNWGEWSAVWSFIISTPSITVTSPNGEENWELGSDQVIAWTSSNAGSEVKIELYKGSNLYATLAGSTPNNGSYNWSIPSNYDVDNDYTLKIISVDDTNIFDYSDNNFNLYTTNYVKIYGVCFVYFGPDNTLHIGDVTMTFTSEMGATMTTVTNYPYGHYEQEVPYGWSGSLRASKLGYDFKCDFQGSRQSEYHFENITQDTKVDFWDNRCTDSTATPILVDSTGTLTDIDGNTYKTVKIGDQWWMAENLKVTHYRNGDPITHITSQGDWYTIYLHYGAYCAYDNDESNADTYGYLYNWVAVHDSRHIAPEGWHVSSNSDWRNLEMFLGMSEAESMYYDGWRGTTEGSKLKSRSGWYNEGNGTDEVGFTALPAGYRGAGGNFGNLGRSTTFWTSTTTLIRALRWDRFGIAFGDYNKRDGLSVRLVKD
ncbi:MAG: FISUMP domain-containing protein, partial [bacterium]